MKPRYLGFLIINILISELELIRYCNNSKGCARAAVRDCVYKRTNYVPENQYLTVSVVEHIKMKCAVSKFNNLVFVILISFLHFRILKD